MEVGHFCLPELVSLPFNDISKIQKSPSKINCAFLIRAALIYLSDAERISHFSKYSN